MTDLSAATQFPAAHRVPPSVPGTIWHHFGRLRLTPGTVLALAWVLVLVLSAVVPWLLAPHGPLAGDTADKLTSPSLSHWFGTDHLGRDVLSRVIHGTAVSLGGALTAVAVAFVIGGVVGIVAGYTGGVVEDVLMRAVDVLLAIPSLLVAMMLITVLGYGTLNVALAVGIASVAVFARVMRASVVAIRANDYIEASQSFGARWGWVVAVHVLPDTVRPLLSLATLEFGGSMLAISALSFLGYGAPPPSPEWGTLIAGGRDYLGTAWWLTVLPGLVLLLTVLTANKLSRVLS